MNIAQEINCSAAPEVKLASDSDIDTPNCQNQGPKESPECHGSVVRPHSTIDLGISAANNHTHTHTHVSYMSRAE